eukprot:3024193-Prymnesium_polylepis.1
MAHLTCAHLACECGVRVRRARAACVRAACGVRVWRARAACATDLRTRLGCACEACACARAHSRRSRRRAHRSVRAACA